MKKHSLLRPLQKYWYLIISYLVLVFLLTQIIVIGSNNIAELTDQVFAGESIDLLPVITPFIMLVLVGTIISFLAKYLQASLSLSIQIHTKNDIVKKLPHLPYSYLDHTGSGTIMNKLVTDVFQMEVLFSEMLPEFFVSIITITTVSIYIFQMDMRLFLVTMISYPLLLWVANKISVKMGQLTGTRRDLYDALETTVLDSYHGILIGKAYNLNEISDERSFRIIDEILENEYIRTVINSFSTLIGNLVRWIPQLICYLFALYEIQRENLTLGTLMAFIILLERIVKPLGQMPTLFNGLREQYVSYKRLMDLMNQNDESTGLMDYPVLSEGVAISLKHICFSYDSDHTIYHDLSLQIPVGSQVAFVGSSGSGKSTILKLLCRFYQEQSGEYTLFGHDANAWKVSALRDKFALVSQNTFLFPGSIFENIAFGKDGASREQVVEACKKANIHEFILGLPNGYDTYVGERGSLLSGGQKQRISIARAIMKDAPILLLDEPTSAVDVETEALIKEAIHKISINRTVITIAHRLSTTKEANTIFVFDHGSILEQGTHETLMKKQGAYYHLYQKEDEIHE